MVISNESQQVVGLELGPGFPVNGYYSVSLGAPDYVPAHDVPFNELIFLDGSFDRPPMVWYPSTNSVGNTICRAPNGAGFGTFESRRNTGTSVQSQDVPGILLSRATFSGTITRVPITNADVSRMLNFSMVEAANIALGPGIPSKIHYRGVPTMIRGPWFLGNDARTYQTMDPCDLQFAYEFIDYEDPSEGLSSMSFALPYFFEAQKASTRNPTKRKYFFLNQVTSNTLPYAQTNGEEDEVYLAKLRQPLSIPGAPSIPNCFVTFDMSFSSTGDPILPASGLYSSGYPSGATFSVEVSSSTSDIIKKLKTFTSGNSVNWPYASLLPIPAVRVVHPDGYDYPFPKGGATSPSQVIT